VTPPWDARHHSDVHGAVYRDVVDAGATSTPTRKDRFIAKLVSFLARAVYREIDVYVPATLPPGTPVVTVANHFGGFSDALVLLDVLPRRPGIVARDVIWKVPLVGRAMNWIGGIPVHKPEDRGAATGNDQMFASCYGALGDGRSILIFPEGVTRNEPSIAPVKTGAARIALGARASGVSGIQIVPVGIHYEDKAALRSRVFVNVGLPIDVDGEVDRRRRDGERGQPVDADDREAVRELTGDIETSLRRVAPDYAGWNEAHLLLDGAEIVLRSRLGRAGADVPLGLRDRLANTLADRPAAGRAAVCRAVADYRTELDAVGFSDAELHEHLGTGRFARAFLWQVLVGLFLFPFALVGAVINVVPFLVVKAVGAWRVAPSVQATVKPIVAFVSFGIVWGVVIWRAVSAFGWGAGLVAFVLLPVYSAAVVLLAERVSLLWQLLRRWRASAGTRNLEQHLAADRAAVVEAVLAA
jgi:glycerol-3-phosphate O-acyltransferase/dihydroxyacetone phosphate acyltransferase